MVEGEGRVWMERERGWIRAEGEGAGSGRVLRMLEGEGGTGGRQVGRDKTELPPRRHGDDLGGSEFIQIS